MSAAPAGNKTIRGLWSWIAMKSYKRRIPSQIEPSCYLRFAAVFFASVYSAALFLPSTMLLEFFRRYI
jgi:hypothetical protein